MPLSQYTYNVQTAFPNKQVDSDRLMFEIRQSAITLAVDHIDVSADSCDIYFKAPLSSIEEIALQQLVAAHSGKPLPEPRNSDGMPYFVLWGSENRVQVTGRNGDEVIQATHNFCDPTTWYQESGRATEVLTNPSGDGVTWISANDMWTDMYHGKVKDETIRRMEADHQYAVVVVVAGETKTMRRPFKATWETGGGDYYVDYKHGHVIFKDPIATAPRATYSFAQTSGWSIAASPGKRLEIEAAETQFSQDVELNDTIIMAVDVLTPGGWVEVQKVAQYATMCQLIDDALGSYPLIPAIDPTNTLRGAPVATCGFPFRYGTTRAIPYSAGARLRFYLEDHIPFGGFRATATVYGTSYDESPA